MDLILSVGWRTRRLVKELLKASENAEKDLDELDSFEIEDETDDLDGLIDFLDEKREICLRLATPAPQEPVEKKGMCRADTIESMSVDW
jgi:hypothetical protein